MSAPPGAAPVVDLRDHPHAVRLSDRGATPWEDAIDYLRDFVCEATGTADTELVE